MDVKQRILARRRQFLVAALATASCSPARREETPVVAPAPLPTDAGATVLVEDASFADAADAGADDAAPTFRAMVCLSIRILERPHFAKGQSRIDGSSKSILDETIRVLKDHPDFRLLVEGHSDPSEPAAVAASRAAAVRAYLEAGGIDRNRLETASAGAKHPVESNETEAGRAANRRVEFHIIER